MPQKKSSRKTPKKKPAPIDLGPLNATWRLGGASYLPLRLLLVAKLSDRYIARLLSDKAGLSVAEWRVVAQLALLDDSSVRELSTQAWVDPAEVSRAVAGLEKRQLVERHFNERDRRSPRFSLTRKGLQHFKAFRSHWGEFQNSLVAKLTGAEIAAMEHAMSVLARACLDLLDQDAV